MGKRARSADLLRSKKRQWTYAHPRLGGHERQLEVHISNGKSPDIKTRVFQPWTSGRNKPTKRTVDFRLPFVAHERLCLNVHGFRLRHENLKIQIRRQGETDVWKEKNKENKKKIACSQTQKIVERANENKKKTAGDYCKDRERKGVGDR